MGTERDSRPVNQETSPLSQAQAPRERFFRRERRSVPDARTFARRVLAEWGACGREDDVLLCVSELATNALVHGVPPGRGFLLRMLPYGDGGVRVEVHDSGGGVPAVPEEADAPEPGEGGRGLLLVGELADKWGVGERDPGKVVWCEFATAPAPHGRSPRSSPAPPGSTRRSAVPRTPASP
ncbi:ATP-binding protein [Streptomyces sp. NWU339]|uniref:ATP-binding protein n=1 Tax=Streptomyces sp. NWU339 TaxID=2185284 RepID=UPI0015E8090E|nr:ATP-binding protein [Streptomyces sp. NWU339]